MRLAPIVFALACSLALPQTPASAQVAPQPVPLVALPTASPGAACDGDLPQPDDSSPSADYERRASSKDPCAVADDNLAREEAEILKLKPPAAAARREAWDH